MNYHYNHVVIFFLPGAAGNFIGRCLNLLNNVNCFVDSKLLTFPKTIEEKLELLSYREVVNRTSTESNWIDFERKIGLFYNVSQWHEQISHGQYVVQLRHPDSNNHHNNVRSKNDRNFLVYIDPTEVYEWHFLNCLYKNSFPNVNYFIGSKEIIQDPDVFQLKLKGIITNIETFWYEFIRLCNHIECKVSPEEEQAIRTLYNQWITTTLPENKFEEFKNQIGLNIQFPSSSAVE